MKTVSHNDFMALNRVIGDIYAARDAEAFYQAVFASIKTVIPCELSSFTEVDFAPTPVHCIKVICGSEQHSRLQGNLFGVFQALVHEHPFVPHINTAGVIKITDYASQAKFRDTGIYNEYYQHLDIDSQISFALPLEQEKLSLFTLSRNKRDFTERDRLILTLLRPHLMSALRNVMELEQLRLERDLLQKGAESEQQGAVLFRADGLIVCISAYAKTLLADYFGLTLQEGDNLPIVLQQWVAVELPTFGIQQRVERKPFIAVKDGNSLAVQLLNDVVTGDRILFMSEKPILSSAQILNRYNLSGRETETLLLLSQGKTNAEIALILAVSKRTIEKHLERVFAKLGVETRTAAAAVLRGAQ